MKVFYTFLGGILAVQLVVAGDSAPSKAMNAAIEKVDKGLAGDTNSEAIHSTNGHSMSNSSADTVQILPELPGGDVLKDETTRAAYLKAMQRYFHYRESGYDHRMRLFEWQLWSSRAIFAVVLILVFVGIYFAAIQFHKSLSPLGRHSHANQNAPTTDDPNGAQNATPMPVTQLEITAKGVVVNSSVLGVVILVISLAFFYLYLVYVYPIQNLF